MLSQFPTIVDAIEWRAAERPQQTAITFLEGEAPPISWTYEQLTRRAKAIAAALRSMNLAGKTALLIHPPGLEFVAALYGCFSAGVLAGCKGSCGGRQPHQLPDTRGDAGALGDEADLSERG
jgi:acyl-CoA synthetase (AMP-forming)/AMP-acid ligase II